MDSFTFCSDNSVQNSKSEENFSIRIEEKNWKSFHEDSVSKIPSDVPTVNPSEFPSDLSSLMQSEMESGDPFAVHRTSPSIMLYFNPSRNTSLIPS